MISIDIKKHLRHFELDLSIEVADAETLTVVGPSGCGKTTLLNCIAGLVAPDGGRIQLGERPVFDPEARIDTPAEKRRIGYVFQDYALFPHLSVFDNVAYGLRAQRHSRSSVTERVERFLNLLKLTPLARCRPEQLSGGEQQRVALARALAVDSQALLLDEPLGALDVSTRQHLRMELRKLLAQVGVSTIIVTHDYADALAFGGRILVMSHGQVEQMGTHRELTMAPRSRFVAELTGVNYFEGHASPNVERGHIVEVGKARVHIATDIVGGICASLFPCDVMLSVDEPHTSARNVFRGTVGDVTQVGERLRVRVDSDLPLVAELTPEAYTALDLREGGAVFASFKATAVRVTSGD
ncbi:MAG: ABC transporter ATP-binding protein [Lentisphaerae bacterium]|jgi:molybdate transport system ATP-binding protein|nr:ABC transporter ATP-binding protein [Lentisphaerota bacterium]MBT4816269.1 ABC transporter ATP-binding protein [Lentisphaerota bacterium]MBT5608814.1 ABC transporter ATP-binding protein [Lentisphaerota bacterium]MBT7059974.1 ABC transporter ATP-binding protein [Lentisphaerota bacterium]MBT7840300.1 ABC transporter ATP-binding protein [Lentisphaerota bacterium]